MRACRRECHGVINPWRQHEVLELIASYHVKLMNDLELLERAVLSNEAGNILDESADYRFPANRRTEKAEMERLKTTPRARTAIPARIR